MHSLPCARALSTAVALTVSMASHGQTVALSGMLGGSALIMVDGAAPKWVAVGESFRGVKIVSTQGDLATIEIGGKRHTTRVGDAPTSVVAAGTGTAAASANKVVLTAGEGGHFFTLGQINGRTATMVIDTGATAVSLSATEAQRLGLEYKSGQAMEISTANGVVPGWRIKLASIRVGDVMVYGVDGVVSSGDLPVVLLGNSFLAYFQMTRTNDQMVLDKRF